jgi:enoyl-CoA hydratase/carnithine racemase
VSEDLLLEKGAGVLRVTLNRPARLNAITQSLYRELRGVLMEAELDPAVEVVIITGAGRAFSSGGDLSDLSQNHQNIPLAEIAEAAWNSSATFAQVESMAKPVVAKVNGLAHAGGFVLAMCCDIVVASDEATFRLPETLLGLVDVFAAAHLPLSIGMPRAKYLTLTCAQITASQAESWGLIARAVPAAELDAATDEIISAILATNREAREWEKVLLNHTLPAPEIRGLRSTVVAGAVGDRTSRFRRDP